MKKEIIGWKNLGIRRKFRLIFMVMLGLVTMAGLTAHLSFLYIRSAEQDIRKCTEIGQLVLEMDRGMERARRLHGDFFLSYPTIGLQKAHEQYAQPSVRQIAQVISMSSDLQKKLFPSELINISKINQIEVNLYLSSAKRFADTSIEAVELISTRAAPERGLEPHIEAIALTVEEELKEFHPLLEQYKKARVYYKDYLISRQRFQMQSAFNVLDALQDAIDQEPRFEKSGRDHLFSLFTTCRNLAEQLLKVDFAIKGKLRDFTLQEQTVTPISTSLIDAVRSEMKNARQLIDRAYQFTGAIILSIALFGIFATLSIAKLLSTSITRNILRLTESAQQLSKGNLSVRVQEEGQDELGQLARIFNGMAARLEDLVENLEKKVVRRTVELSESEERFRLLIDDLPRIAVQGYDSKTNIIFWNRGSEMIYGYTAEEAFGRKLEDLIIPESMKETHARDVNNWLKDDVHIPSSELTLRDKNGKPVSIYSSQVMQVSSKGEKTMYRFDLDLADLKRAQEKGERSESLYRQLFDHSSSGVAVYEAVDDGQDFVFRDFNTAGEKLDGVERGELLGRKVTEVFPGVEDFGLLEIFRRVWRTGEPDEHPLSVYVDGNVEAWRENKIYKLPSGEIVAVYDDITRQKQAEDAKHAVELRLQRAQKMEAIGLLAGGVAHDLNNILSGIIGYPELILLQLPQESELRKPIEAIKESGERAAAVVADLLTVARGVASTRKPGQLNGLIKEYLSSPEYRYLHSLYPYVEYHQQLGDDLPDISCSAVHIKKCIMNLVTNAAEAIETSGTITLSTNAFIPDQQWADEHALEQRKYVVLTVTDTGTGITKEDISHIFEPFYTKKVMGKSGTGLGLAVVWNTVKDHQGTVIVRSQEQGTSFKLFFPGTEEAVVEQKIAEKTDYRGQGEKVLVVDDEAQQLDIAQRMLESLGYDVVCCNSGEEALEFLQEHQDYRADVMLLDMLMGPGINGQQTYESVVKGYPGQKAIIASGFSESEEVRKARQLGAGEFLKKPYTIEQLGQVIKKELERENDLQ